MNIHRAGIFVIALLLITGCERTHSDMGGQDKYNTYQSSTFFPDGASARPLVAGTVPQQTEQWQDVPEPKRFTSEMIAHGQQSFDIYCSVCHGRLANGEGMIVQRGLTRPPSFHVDRLIKAPDSHFYDVMTNGFGQMFSYSERVPPMNRWEIVAYIRVLQSAGEHAPADVKRVLIGQGDRKTPTVGGGG
jgi:mono/diheme cytochrome c family protein